MASRFDSDERKRLLPLASIARTEEKEKNSYSFLHLLIIGFCILELLVLVWYTFLRPDPTTIFVLRLSSEPVKIRNLLWLLLVIKGIVNLSFLRLVRRPSSNPFRSGTVYQVFAGLVYGAMLVGAFSMAHQIDRSSSSSSTGSTIILVPYMLTIMEWIAVHLLLTTDPTSLIQNPYAIETTTSTSDDGFNVQVLLQLLRPYFWPKGVGHRVRALSTYFLLLISKAANLVAPLYMARATNALGASSSSSSSSSSLSTNQQLASVSIVIYCGLTLISKVFKELQSVAYLRVKQTAYSEIAEFTYRHLQSLSIEWHIRKKLGDVLRSMDRGVESMNSVVSYLFLYLLPTLVESILVVFIFAHQFQLVTLAMVAFISLVVYALLTIVITAWRKKFREAVNKHDNAFHDRATDCLMNFETVKYFTNEEYEVSKYCDAVKAYQHHSTSNQASLSLLNSTQQLVIQLTILGVLILAVPHVLARDHGMNVGNFVAITVYLMNLFAPLSFLGTIYNMVIKAYVDMKKLMSLLSISPDIKDSVNATRLVLNNAASTELEFRHVCFHYPSQDAQSGLKDISFVVPAQTTTAIVGTTGAGKSTISRLIFRFYDIQSGEILFNHRNITSIRKQSLRKNVGIVPQDTILFNNTILHNVQYGNMEASFEQVKDAAKRAQIYDMIESLPEKWNTLVGERGLRLSGGEKQRIAIARALLKNPPLVILDEATSSLDTATEQLIQRALDDLYVGRTTIIIAHRLSTIRKAHQILVLENGSIVEKGTESQLLELPNGVYNRLWSLQQQATDDDDMLMKGHA